MVWLAVGNGESFGHIQCENVHNVLSVFSAGYVKSVDHSS